MTTETIEVDPLEYVRGRIDKMPGGDLPRLALDAGVTTRTLYNIKNGADAKYSTVMALHKALKEAEAAAAIEASKR